VDVIVEGKITNEEGLDEVLQTIIDLKTVVSPVLRINCLDSRIQGKIGFAQGGFILGAKIEETGELGYPAVRRLLLIRNGNYAILDPEKQVVPDINQTLWLDAGKVIKVLPDLPQSPESLLSGHAPAAQPFAPPVSIEELTSISRRPPEKASVSGVNSKARQFDSAGWRRRYAMIIIFAAIIGAGAAIMQYRDRIWPYLQSFQISIK
jgi:hypothetical protein